ncbi:MAG: hypothetical protein ABS942_15465 [Solibacillus sp.]
MDPIKQALTEELEQKTLSLHKKQAILQHQQPQRKLWLPKIVAVCIAAIALFLLVTTSEQKPEPLTATGPLGSVDTGVVEYFNKQATREASDLYNGDAYLLRLALENNSQMFYEDSQLSLKNRFLVSELLHYIQEASWQGDVQFSLQPVTSIEELVILAPQVIAELKPQVNFSYMTVADEKKHQWKFYSYDTKAWVGYMVVLALLLMAIMKLGRDKHWIILSCCVFLAIVAAYQPITKPYKDTAAYDEHTLIEVVSNQLEEMNVKASGKPVLQYAATIHTTRAALVAFDDFKVLATFTYKNGHYVKDMMTWHTGELFRETAFDTMENPLQHTLAFGFADGHNVATLRLADDARYKQEIAITQNQPTIIFYKKPQDLSGFGVFNLDEQGQQVQ